MSPISSRNSVPPSACSKRPRRVVCAPVKAPRSWPKSSLSSRSFGIAAVLMATNGPCARGLCLCSARATSSLPVPLSPVIITVTLLWLSRPMARKTSCIARRLAQHLGRLRLRRRRRTSSRRLSSTARRISSTALVRSKGLGRYSKAPPWKALTALSRSDVRRHDDHRQPGVARLHVRPAGRCRCRRACGCRSPAPAAHRRPAPLSTSRGLANERTVKLFALQRLLQHEADGLIVVDDPDGFHAAG